MNKIKKILQSDLMGWPLIVVVIVGFAAFSMLRESLGYKKIETKTALKEILTGNTLQGDAFWFRYEPNGQMKGFVSDVEDKGTWQILEGHYCERWQVWGDGERYCWQIEQNGDLIKRMRLGDRSIVNVMTLVRNKQN